MIIEYLLTSRRSPCDACTTPASSRVDTCSCTLHPADRPSGPATSGPRPPATATRRPLRSRPGSRRSCRARPPRPGAGIAQELGASPDPPRSRPRRMPDVRHAPARVTARRRRGRRPTVIAIAMALARPPGSGGAGHHRGAADRPDRRPRLAPGRSSACDRAAAGRGADRRPSPRWRSAPRRCPAPARRSPRGTMARHGRWCHQRRSPATSRSTFRRPGDRILVGAAA